MENAPFNTLMIETLRRSTSSFPHLRAQLDAYLEMKRKADERDTAGKLTADARKARETLRSPLLVQMPLKRAVRQHEKTTRKRKTKAEKAVAEALLTFVDYDQYQIELDILNEDNSAIDADVPPSRERPDQNKVDAMTRPFIERLIKRGISPSTIGRLTDLAADLIARLIADRRDDPDFQNSANIWVQMFRAGILDAFVNSMTPEEATAIDYARQTLKKDAGTAEFARAAREDCGLPAGFSTTFLAGLYHLRSCLADLSEGQAQAYSRAQNLVHDRDVDLLGKMLHLTQQSDLDRLQALVHFITQRTAFDAHDNALAIQLVAVRKTFERLEAHNRSTDDWARDVPNMITALAQDFADTVPGVEAFDMLLASGFRLSSTYAEITGLAEQRREEELHDMFLIDIRQACSFDARFKIVDYSVHLDWDEGFEDIDAPIWDRESWECSFGPVFDDWSVEDVIIRQASGPHSGNPEPDGLIASDISDNRSGVPSHHGSTPHAESACDERHEGLPYSSVLPAVTPGELTPDASLFDQPEGDAPKNIASGKAEPLHKEAWRDRYDSDHLDNGGHGPLTTAGEHLSFGEHAAPHDKRGGDLPGSQPNGEAPNDTSEDVSTTPRKTDCANVLAGKDADFSKHCGAIPRIPFDLPRKPPALPKGPSPEFEGDCDKASHTPLKRPTRWEQTLLDDLDDEELR